MKIYLARHGETSGDTKRIFGGEYDDSLTKKGRLQAHHLGKQLVTLKIDAVFISPKKRTKQTYKILQSYIKAKSVIDEGLRVRNHYGVMTGMKESEAKKKFPHLVKLLEADTRNTIEGGEGYHEFLERVMKTYEMIKGMNYKNVLLITHRGFIRAIVREHFKKGNVKVNHSGYIEITVSENEEMISQMVDAVYEDLEKDIT
jgi:broad specificity phosphatase PhoE